MLASDLSALAVQRANELVHMIATDSVTLRFALSTHQAKGLDSVSPTNVDLTTGLAHIQAQVVIPKGMQQVAHEDVEEVTACIHVFCNDVNRGRQFHHSEALATHW
jgi:hypothetical protein